MKSDYLHFKLAELNLGNNALREIPSVLGQLESLKKLYLFGNHIATMPPELLGRFACRCALAASKPVKNVSLSINSFTLMHPILLYRWLAKPRCPQPESQPDYKPSTRDTKVTVRFIMLLQQMKCTGRLVAQISAGF